MLLVLSLSVFCVVVDLVRVVVYSVFLLVLLVRCLLWLSLMLFLACMLVLRLLLLSLEVVVACMVGVVDDVVFVVDGDCLWCWCCCRHVLLL